jgi:hypothetical protein
MEIVEVREENADEGVAFIRRLAAAAARKAGETTEFFMSEMNYRALVPIMRELKNGGLLCQSCRRPLASERDIQIDHILPPRHAKDWARLHAGNLVWFCRACNSSRSGKPFTQWLDEQWGRRRTQ